MADLNGLLDELLREFAPQLQKRAVQRGILLPGQKLVVSFRVAPADVIERDPTDAAQQTSNALTLSFSCKAGFHGKWIAPAKPTRRQIENLLSRFRTKGVTSIAFSRFLLANKNRPGVLGNRVQLRLIHEVLSSPVGKKRYRLGSGFNELGQEVYQVWEVRPDPD